MKIFGNKIWKNLRMCAVGEHGTALIIALLVMGILTAVSLAISALVVREIGVTKMALDAGKAYYAAESGIEIGLLDIKENSPGWEPSGLGDDSGGVVSGEVSGGQDFGLNLKNKADSYPYLDDTKYDLAGAGAEAFYDVLELNESVTIPLFTVDEKGIEIPVTEFRVYFYVGFDLDDLNFGGRNVLDLVLSGWDILRWKIYGLTETEPIVTESINDFTAVSMVNRTDEADEMTNASTPSWFGSVDCSVKDNALSYDKVGCAFFGGSNSGEVKSVGGFDVYSDVICLPTYAREHYDYLGGKIRDVFPCYSIKTFLENHDYNYLTLTNLMNPAVFKGKSKAEGLRLSRLYFRVEAYDGDLPLEYADIDSVGESGGSKVKLNALKKRGGQLPVFNFALYHTKGK